MRRKYCVIVLGYDAISCVDGLLFYHWINTGMWTYTEPINVEVTKRLARQALEQVLPPHWFACGIEGEV